MSDNLTTIIITAISVVFGAGGWKFYEFLIRSKREKQKEEKSEQTIYRDDLKARVDKLETYKENTIIEMSELKQILAKLEVTVKFLQEENNVLKIKLQK
jgi:hypothetical protein|tara:strand:- start:1956 stop:2252 length:297 start_codon:yes stop_codon:yes gene_type:complete